MSDGLESFKTPSLLVSKRLRIVGPSSLPTFPLTCPISVPDATDVSPAAAVPELPS